MAYMECLGVVGVVGCCFYQSLGWCKAQSTAKRSVLFFWANRFHQTQDQSSSAWYSKGPAINVCERLGVSKVLRKSLRNSKHVVLSELRAGPRRESMVLAGWGSLF